MQTDDELMIPDQYRENFKAHTNMEAQAKTLALAIKDDASYRVACAFRTTIDKQLKAWTDAITPAVKAAHQAHKKIKDVENLVANPLENSIETLDPAISRWRAKEENERRLKQEAINRQLRKDEEDRRLKEAEELEKSGKKDEADAVLNEPVRAPEVVLPSTTKVEGISDRVYWSAEIFDIVKLCKAIGEGKASPSAVTANMVFLGGLARSMKNAMNAEWESKGVRAVSRNDIAGGR